MWYLFIRNIINKFICNIENIINDFYKCILEENNLKNIKFNLKNIYKMIINKYGYY